MMQASIIPLTNNIDSNIKPQKHNTCQSFYFNICISFFLKVRNEFYKDTQGALLVFDVSDRSSFEALDHWLTELRNEIGNQTEAENVFFVVCGNKVIKSCRLNEIYFNFLSIIKYNVLLHYYINSFVLSRL